MRRTIAVALLMVCAFVLSGCSIRLGDLTVVSNRNVTLDRVDLDDLPQKRGVVGRDSRWMILVIPMGIPTLEGALDDALAKGDGDVMIDAVIKSTGWWFLIGQNTLEVKGSVVKTRGMN